MNKKAPEVKIMDYISADDYEKLISTEELTNDLDLDHITKVFDELENSSFEVLKSQPFLDNNKFLIRGAVTRIGAYSNIGKSKLAYWLVIQLLKNKYSGMFFSTEVNRHTVLANLVACIDSSPFWEVIKKITKPSKRAGDILSNLQIYDSKQGALFLKTIREFLIANGGHLDFIVTDFCQNIYDYNFSRTEYDRMSNYALELQQLAQHYNVCIIDLSQLANNAIREDFKETGFINFKGSGALYASADIGVLLKRDKIETPDLMEVEIRKHKFNQTGDIALRVDFSTGEFKLVNPKLEKVNEKNKNFLPLH